MLGVWLIQVGQPQIGCTKTKETQMINIDRVYPRNITEDQAIHLDDFLAQHPHEAWMYLIHLKTNPHRSLTNLEKKQYFVREDGLIAIHDTEVHGKGAWDFYDPKEASWLANKDVQGEEALHIWGEGSPGIYKKRGRRPGQKYTRKGPGQDVVVEMQEAAPKKKRGRPRKNPSNEVAQVNPDQYQH